jgi:hypothetical protein
MCPISGLFPLKTSTRERLFEQKISSSIALFSDANCPVGQGIELGYPLDIFSIHDRRFGVQVTFEAGISTLIFMRNHSPSRTLIAMVEPLGRRSIRP